MKQFFFTITAISFLLLSSCTPKEVVITGQLKGDTGELAFSNPNEGTYFLGFRDTLDVAEDGSFELKFNLKQPSFISLRIPSAGTDCKLLVEPGGSYHIIIDSENGTEISGTNEEGQRLYATLPNPSFISMQNRELQKENSLAVIHEKMEEMKSNDLKGFQTLLDEDKISSSFFQLIQKDRDCYYASLESVILQIKMFKVDRNENGEYLLDNGDNLLKAQEKIYTQYPPDDNSLLISSFWEEYAKNFIQNYKQFSKKDFTIESFKEMYTKGTFNTFIIDEAKKNLSGKALEFFQASYIYGVSFQNRFEKELIAMYGQFEKDYPQSMYSKYLTPEIDKVVEFYEKIEGEFSENTSFVENYEQINTLEEAVKSFRGKKVYIDVWATWCGPCKEEFKHSEALKEILKDKDIQMLYISIDEDRNDSQWKDLIKYYNLEGSHIRANEVFRKELMVRYDENAKEPYIAIPWYILIDEEGNVLQKKAKKPSQIVSGEDIF